jgi:hypothetical protein
MTDFIIKKLPYDLTSNAGLALVGQYMKRLGISARVDHKFPVGVGGIANSDILKSYLGLLVVDRSIEPVHGLSNVVKPRPCGFCSAISDICFVKNLIALPQQ